MATELQIAQATAEIYDKFQCSDDDYSSDFGRRLPAGKVLVPLGKEKVDLARLEGMKEELARARARATGRDLKWVRIETHLKFSQELARIMAGTIDPVLQGLTKVEVENEEDEEEVCGVCQDDMKFGEEARSMGCTHRFHALCIFKWLKHKTVCPLCRFPFQTETQKTEQIFTNMVDLHPSNFNLCI